MKKFFAGGPLALLAAFALFAAATTSAGVSQNSNSSTTNTNTHSDHHHGSAAMTADSKFAMEAAMGGMMEVEAGRLAAQKGASADVKQFGQRMVDDHSKANDELMQIAAAKGMTLPTAADPKHQAHLTKLAALSGEKFDREYVKMMLKDHKEDTAAFQREADRGADPEIKGFAARTLPVVQEHLRLIQRISDKMMLRRNGGGASNANANTGQ